MFRTLASFPEELLSRILALYLEDPSHLFPPRNRIALLLVSQQFFRIASPLLYHTLHFHSPCQTSRALDTLIRYPALASAVRRLVFDAIWHDCAGVLALCNYAQDLDIALDIGPGPNDVDAEAFCHVLERRYSIMHLTIRKDSTVYLTHPRPSYLLPRLAQAIHHWTELETVHFAFGVSYSLATLPLAQALSAAPRLRAVRTQVPVVWNKFLIVISTNPRLEKVTLYAEPGLGVIQNRLYQNVGSAVIKGGYFCEDIENAVLGTGMYMMEAKKHARLSELIRAGTFIIRTRAHTTIATLSMPAIGGTPLGAIRAKEMAVELLGSRNSSGAVITQPFSATRRHSTSDPLMS